MKETIGLLALVVLSATTITPTEAQIVANDELAKVEFYGGTVAFRPAVVDALTLTVVGTDYRSSERFRGDQMPAFVPVDREGYPLPDGLYRWELAENPRLPAARAAVSGKPANGRTEHRFPAPAGRTQDGAFTILNGSIVDPTLVEEAAGPVSAISAPVHQHPTETGAAVSYDDSDRATLASQ